jgi:hypothetical protein
VGDRVRLSKYDLFEETFNEFEDHFEQIYQQRLDQDDIAIRYSHENVDGVWRTVVEADFDNDSIFETSIWMDGQRVLVAVQHTVPSEEIA